MKSKKPNAKKFQNWITSEVIPQIRKHGFYIHEEHKPSAEWHEDGYAYFSDKSTIQDDMRAKFLNDPRTFQNRVNTCDKEQVMNTLKRTDDIDLLKNSEKHVIYYYMTSIKNLNDDRMICKVGYTKDIFQRNIELKDRDYKTEMCIIGIKEVNSLADETRFHRMFKKSYGKLQYKCKINVGKEIQTKDELYYYDPKLTYFFDSFKVKLNDTETVDRLETELICERLNNKDIAYENWILKQKLALEKFNNQLLEDKLSLQKLNSK
jgi:hypothetical protein